jgi:cytochrome c5
MERKIMNINKCILSAGALLVVLPLYSQAASTGTAQAPAAQPAAQSSDVHGPKQRDGNEVFAANCSRCHNAPESFSPRISGTIVRHMRVRAGLSKEDEQAILRFLNP